MDSNDLRSYGFTSWKNLSILAKNKGTSISPIPGIYVFKLNKVFGRLQKMSDILYIGSTDNLYRRIYGNYIRGSGGGTTQRIYTYLNNLKYLNKTEVSYIPSNNPKYIEKKLLDEYEKDHHELPPWNRQE